MPAAEPSIRKKRPRPVGLKDEPWFRERVPAGYWHDIRHRRRYLRWLGDQLGFDEPEDWLRISTQHFKDHLGSGVLAYWNGSAIAAVKELYPRREWHEWLFECAPRGFWKDRRNHRRYLDWLAVRLDFRRPEDWYRVSNVDFAKHAGSAFLLEYRSTISKALIKCFPEYDLKEWMFDVCPQRFWESRANRQRYLRWLGKILGYRKPSDWYQLSREIVNQNHGRGFLKAHHDSMVSIARDRYPQHTWHEWLFRRTSPGFWGRPENRRAYLDWLGKKLRFRHPEDWYRLRAEHLKTNYGGAIWTEVDSLTTLLAEYLPEQFSGRSRVLRPLSREQILAWADAHFQRNGTWPTKHSGRVPRTDDTWLRIDGALKRGIRGCPGGKALSAFLHEERGARIMRIKPSRKRSPRQLSDACGKRRN